MDELIVEMCIQIIESDNKKLTSLLGNLLTQETFVKTLYKLWFAKLVHVMGNDNIRDRFTQMLYTLFFTRINLILECTLVKPQTWAINLYPFGNKNRERIFSIPFSLLPVSGKQIIQCLFHKRRWYNFMENIVHNTVVLSGYMENNVLSLIYDKHKDNLISHLMSLMYNGCKELSSDPTVERECISNLFYESCKKILILMTRQGDQQKLDFTKNTINKIESKIIYFH